MKKLLCALALVSPMVAMAEDSPTGDTFNLNVRRIGFDWTKTDMKNANEYQNSSVAALKASDQQNLKGVFDEYDSSYYKLIDYNKTDCVKGYKACGTINKEATKEKVQSIYKRRRKSKILP